MALDFVVCVGYFVGSTPLVGIAGGGPNLMRGRFRKHPLFSRLLCSDAVQLRAQRGASLEPSEVLSSGQQRVLEGILRILQGSEPPVSMHLRLSEVRLGQLPERVAVPRPRP